MRKKSAITQTELKRYLKALHEAGYTSGRVEITPEGKVSVIVGEPSEPISGTDDFDTLIERIKPDAQTP